MVKMTALETISSPDFGTKRPGDEFEVSDDRAERLIRAKLAERTFPLRKARKLPTFDTEPPQV